MAQHSFNIEKPFGIIDAVLHNHRGLSRTFPVGGSTPENRVALVTGGPGVHGNGMKPAEKHIFAALFIFAVDKEERCRTRQVRPKESVRPKEWAE